MNQPWKKIEKRLQGSTGTFHIKQCRTIIECLCNLRKTVTASMNTASMNNQSNPGEVCHRPVLHMPPLLPTKVNMLLGCCFGCVVGQYFGQPVLGGLSGATCCFASEVMYRMEASLIEREVTLQSNSVVHINQPQLQAEQHLHRD
ncbi:hypothetical protein [Endozoicomonas sp. SCSIO W0465]|uniref:hypothetical protein n=1 Tax=Endozoicomonas sp. SCSIO W0465 TaxID=2918516 RepID=UPI002075CCF5|nr:hypothetical protein [Endozoicomonas sp. SCSIO W0465]USE37335.1 hypothetical protein MJO57_03660 [Endozoicomonas sp. SCSIO W0465]